jgi:membrane protease YdiL (CAAX protease family)
MALLGATLLPAAYLWVEVGGALPSWHEYPSLSQRDPVELLFLYGEHLRLSYAGHSATKVQEGKQRFADSIAELKAELLSYKRIAPRAGGARERRVLRDFEALTVVSAGWGDPAARERLEHVPADDVPDYAQRRRNEIIEGRTDRDQTRAARHRRYQRARRWSRWLEVGLAAPATLFLYLARKQRSALELGPVPVELVWGLVLWVWCEAAIKLAGFVTGRDVPVLGVLHPFSKLVAIPFVLALIRGAWGRAPETPLVRMRSLPAREGRLDAVLWTLLALAASTAVTWGIRSAAKPLGLRPVWSEGLDAGLLVGTGWEAAGRISSLLVGAPFLEEILYRGLLFGGLSRALGLKWAIFLSSLAFALMHGYGFASTLIVALDGCIWALAYVRTRSLWPGMLVHALVNVTAVLDNYSFLL